MTARNEKAEVLRLLKAVIPYRLKLIARGECVDASLDTIDEALAALRAALAAPASGQGVDEPIIQLQALSSHVRACPEYANLVGDMDFVDQAVRILQAGSASRAEPVEYQYRMRPTWEPEGKGWTKWEKCSHDSYEDYVRTPLIGDWQHEVRALCAALQPTNAAMPAQQADSGDGERAGKKLYEASLDDSIHCNRHPAFSELSDKDRARWIKKASPKGGEG